MGTYRVMCGRGRGWVLAALLLGSVARANLFTDLLYDCYAIPRDFFTSRETYYVGAFFAPAFFASFSCDRPIHSCFYCRHQHKNLCQMPTWCHLASDKGAVVLGLGMGAGMLAWPDHEIREAGAAFSVGMTYMLVIKDLFKTIQCEENRRPRNGSFDRHKKYYGGCPSGHLGLAAYITTFMARSFGTVWAIPFGIWTALSFFASLNGNRHYLSQLIAGGCLGAAVGLAAAKVFCEYKTEQFSCKLAVDEGGGPVVRASYAF